MTGLSMTWTLYKNACSLGISKFQTGVTEENYEQTQYSRGRFIKWLFALALFTLAYGA